MTSSLKLADGRTVALDGDGHLADREQWSEQVAEAFAARDGITLGEEHWRVLRLLRSYYEEYEISPPMRALVKLLRAQGFEAVGSRELYRLFPEGPAKQACRYAGLPRPVSCI